jgi:hypothetical protein
VAGAGPVVQGWLAGSARCVGCLVPHPWLGGVGGWSPTRVLFGWSGMCGAGLKRPTMCVSMWLQDHSRGPWY